MTYRELAFLFVGACVTSFDSLREFPWTYFILVFVFLLLFLDSIDTPSALRHMQELVKLTNIYISGKKEKKESSNHQLLEGITKYLTHMLKVCTP